MRYRTRLSVITSVGVALLAVVAPVASASTVAVRSHNATAAAIVQWNMDVVSGSVTDAGSGLKLDLKGTWSSLKGSVGFGWAGSPSIGLADDRGQFSPALDDFAVAVSLISERLPTVKNYSPNVVQKGLAGVGGQWKVELHPNAKWGVLAGCRFEGDQGSILLRDTSHTRLDDDRPHVVACWRAGKTLGVTVDGRDQTLKDSVGLISPRAGVTVANKGISAGAEDQLKGSISCITFVKGQGAKDLALSRARC